MKNKNTIIPILVFLVTFILFIGIYFKFNSSSKYSCYDYENDINYTFSTSEEMHEFCDKLDYENDDEKLITKYPIYDDLINADEDTFAFYPYINNNKELTIIIAISDCDNPDLAKEKAEKWFTNHSYNIRDYTIEYEYPCEYN